jgi:alkyl sulfatase BDS1-like metallo-beta-lactamase superfamily hydrolase
VPDPANASGPRPAEGAVTQPQEARAVAAIARALAAAARRAESGGTSLDAERVRWAATLEDEGLSADQAEAAAAKIAANLARSVGVARADAAARGHDLQGVATLPAFGRDSALRIAYDIGAMGEK